MRKQVLALGLAAGAFTPGCVGQVQVGNLDGNDGGASRQSTSGSQGYDASSASQQAPDASSTSQLADTGGPVIQVQDEDVSILASGLTSPYVLALDATSVYWADWGDGSLPGNGAVASVALGGGPTTTLVSGLRMPGGIGVDATGVYYTASGGLFVVPTAGGTPQSLSSSFTNDNIVLGSSMVLGTGGDDGLYGFPIGGTAAQSLAGPIGIGGQNTYGLAVDSTSVYWSCFAGTCPVLKTPLDGGTSATLATGHIVFGVAVDATNVYWAEMGNGTIMKVPVNGGQATTVASGLNGPNQIVSDGDSLYVTTGTQGPGATGSIVKMAKDGSVVTVLVSEVGAPSGIAVDATSVYWTTLGNGSPASGTIMKATPK